MPHPTPHYENLPVRHQLRKYDKERYRIVCGGHGHCTLFQGKRYIGCFPTIAVAVDAAHKDLNPWGAVGHTQISDIFAEPDDYTDQVTFPIIRKFPYLTYPPNQVHINQDFIRDHPDYFKEQP